MRNTGMKCTWNGTDGSNCISARASGNFDATADDDDGGGDDEKDDEIKESQRVGTQSAT